MSDDPGDRAERISEPVEDRFEYLATIETSVAASALATGRRRLSVAMFVAGLVVIMVISAFAAIARLGILVSLVAVVVFSLLVGFVFQFDALVRWQLKRYYSSLFGVKVVVEVRSSGITVRHGDMTTELPWASITDVKANDSAVVFLKGRGPIAIMPTSAFESPGSRDAFISKVMSRIRQPA
jgi:hypothetical protein